MNIHETNWVALARAGDRGAMHELYERHRTRIFNLAYRYVRNVADAEDVLQETFIKAFRSLEKAQLDDESFFSTWLYRIAVNCAMDHFRQQRRRQVDDGWHRDLLAIEESAAPLSPEAACQRQETQARVEQVLTRLSPRKRMIVVLRHYQQMKIQEIAGHLGCSQGSVKKQLFTALAQMRIEMEAPLEGEPMKCKEFKDRIFLYQDGALPPPEWTEFAEHRRSCPACAGEFSALEKAAALLAERPAAIPVPDWERSWHRIAAAVAPRPRRRKAWFFFPRWAMVAGGFLVFFILGIAFARLDFFPARGRDAGVGEAAFSFTTQDYFSLLQPVMAEYGNARAEGALAPGDQERVRRLLNDLYLLKLRAESSRDGALRLLLGDIELVLLEMVHLDRSRPDDVRRLSELIQEKGLPMKLRVFKSTQRKITQI